MGSHLPDGASKRQLETFLSHLREGLAGHLEHLLAVMFSLRFPDVSEGGEAAFDPARPCPLERRIAAAATPELRAQPSYRELLRRHRALHRLVNDILAKAAADQLRPTQLSRFLRAAQTFQDFADKLGADLATALIDVDEVTGLLKRHAMERELGEELARARRGERPFAVAMADVDHFKKVNDQHGHVFGDHVLAELAARLTAGLRPYDRVFRYGGEEFLLLLPETSRDKAGRVLDRLRAAIGAEEIRDGKTAANVTLSIGVAEFAPGRSVESLIEHADTALYRAKEAGRDRVELEWAECKKGAAGARLA